MSDNRYKGMNPYAVGRAKWWARELIRQGHCLEFGVDGLEQEFMVVYALEKEKLPKGQEPEDWLIREKIKDKALMLRRKSKTDKRKANYNTVSLDAKVSDEGDMSLIDLMADTGEISGYHTLENLSEQSISSLLDLEVEKMRASLDDDGRKLFDALREFTIAEIADEYGVTEKTIRNRKEKLGNELKKKGF